MFFMRINRNFLLLSQITLKFLLNLHKNNLSPLIEIMRGHNLNKKSHNYLSNTQMQSLMWLLQFTAESPYLIEATNQINLSKLEFQIRTFFSSSF